MNGRRTNKLRIFSVCVCHCAIQNVVDANGPMYKLKFYHVVAVIATNCPDTLDEEAKWEK